MADDSDRIINRNWRVIRKIGQGGMGTVWEVRHKDIRRMRSAVKEIKSNLTTNDEVVRRFLREVRLMAELEGVDHIVRVTEFDRHEGFVFMTLVDGPSLAQVIEQRGALPYEQVVRFGHQIAAALSVVHERGIVHRDIKPPNILIDEKHQKAYLTDFGIAKKLDLSEGDETIDGTLTVEGTLTVDVQYMGTPRYSSPEQLRVEYPPHPLWDIYAMGVLLYEAYSGLRYLPQFKRYHEFLQTVGTNPEFGMSIPYSTPPPPAFAALVEHCLQRDPARRLQSTAEMAERLRACEEELRRVVVSSGLTPRPTQPTLEDQETLREDFRDPRRDLREEIERRFGSLEEIEGTLVAVGLNLPTGDASETLGHQLRDISIIEGEGQFQRALGQLETLRDKAAAAQARAEAAAREGLARRVDELVDARRDLEHRAGRWLDATRLAPVDEALAAARRGLADAHWKLAGDDLGPVPEALRTASEAARRAAQTAIEGMLAEIADQLAAVQRLDAGAVPRGLDLGALRAQVDTQLAADDLEAAAQQTEAAGAMIAAALDRARAAGGERLRAARRAFERQLGEIDAAAARQVAPDLLDDVERRRAAGAAAEAAGDVAAALAAYAEAGRAAGAVAAQVASAHAEERERLAAALRALVGETADAPPEVVAEARAAAQAVLEQPPVTHAAAAAALTDAATKLAGARDELPAFAAAAEQRAAAEAVRTASRDVSLPRAERRRADAAAAAAAEAFARRAWAEAATRYAEAQTLWESAVAAARARSQQEECAALRASLVEELDGLAALEAARAALALPADDTPAVAGLRDALEPLGAHERAGAFADAIAGFRALRERAAQAQAAHTAVLRDAVAANRNALAARGEDLAARAGELLPPAQRGVVDRTAARADEAARTGDWAGAGRALADAAAALERIEAELRAAADAAVRARLATIDSDLKALAALEAAPPDGADLEALTARAATALDEGRIDAALRTVDDAVAVVATARAAREQELTERARVLRAAMESKRGDLDAETARVVSPAAIEEAERRAHDATLAERQHQYLDAIRAYEAAGAALDVAARAVDERRRAELAELAAKRAAGQRDLGAVIERAQQAPADVVGTALHAAEAVLGQAEPALGDLSDAAAALERLLDAVPAYQAAVERRTAAEARHEQIAQRRLSRRQLKPARQCLHAAAAAFDGSEWAVAAERYGEAERLFAELETLPPPKPARWPYAAAAALLLAVGIGAIYPTIVRWLTTRETHVTVASAPAAPQPAKQRVAAPPAQEPVAAREAQPPVVPPPAQPVAVPHIASAEPAGADVRVDEGGAQKFSLQLADASADTDIQWLLAGKPVADARGKTSWSYRPPANAAAGAPYNVTAEIGGGTADGQTRSWKVAINRLPQIVNVQPPQGQDVKKEIGQTESFAVQARDADGDALTYQWTVDGKAAGGNAPTLDVPVERDHESIALAITDGKQHDPLRLEWQLTGREGEWAAQPAALKELEFGGAQKFKLVPPAGKMAPGTQIAWAVNGQKMADGPTFLYQASDPGAVGAAPVQVRATATDASGKPFSKEWSFEVAPPPPPKVTGASPSPGVVDTVPGAAQKLTLAAAAPVTGQHFTYMFDVNGKQSTSTTPSLSVTPSDSGDTVVVAAIEDNFKQRSKEMRWALRVTVASLPKAPVAGVGTADSSAVVRGWLDQYRGALNGKDVPTQCSLLDLDAGKCAQLGKALDAQGNLRVAFDNVAIEPLADGRVRARYTRVDDFVDPSGKSQSRSTPVTQTFRLTNGKAQIDRSGQ